ncbi:hypothetical protein [Massilimicrobiota timonensis]|uniref:hypothetical protein n=1 Tax=Massilimicrobiota timonensis TaxID=1776392 RepID=UPI0019611E3C|nr:hypothetical protein [Massilimicrobiota timonensis]MBM6966921.1 hypothetical protein [Massilimicrobiota timonensis]
MKNKIIKNKKYIVICSLFFCLCVGVTLALTSMVGNKLTNSFTLGSVETEIDEDGPKIHDDHIDKQPYVKNTGTNSALVRMRVTISPDELIKEYGINLVYNDGSYEYNPTEDNWDDTADYWVYSNGFWYYTGIIEANERTEPLFTKVTGNDIIENNGLISELEGLEITVYYDSIQSVARGENDVEIKATTGDINNETTQQLWSIFDQQKN